jgi:hypothetical protein
VRALILDQQRHVVADLGTYPSSGAVTSLTLDRSRFVPELDRVMHGTDNNGGIVSWNGAGSGGTALPNGYYRFQVQSPGGALVEAEVYLEHQPWDAGNVLVSLLPKDSQARIRWNYSEAVDLSFDLYNLAGELIWQARGTGISGEVDWALLSASGQPVADGIYVLRAQASSLDGAVDDLKIIKLAVVR